MPIGDVAQFLERIGQQLQHGHRPVEHTLGIVVQEPAPDPAFGGEGLAGQLVQLPDGGRVLVAVGQDPLPIADLVRFDEAGQHHRPDGLANELVALRHRPEEEFETQVLDQTGGVWRQRGLRIEVAIGMEEERLHAPIRRFTLAYESLYFSAIAAA